ncbi:MAG: hypothetical protein V2A62_02095 [Candidatus Woesearchaeota archaeon]
MATNQVLSTPLERRYSSDEIKELVQPDFFGYEKEYKRKHYQGVIDFLLGERQMEEGWAFEPDYAGQFSDDKGNFWWNTFSLNYEISRDSVTGTKGEHMTVLDALSAPDKDVSREEWGKRRSDYIQRVDTLRVELRVLNPQDGKAVIVEHLENQEWPHQLQGYAGPVSDLSLKVSLNLGSSSNTDFQVNGQEFLDAYRAQHYVKVWSDLKRRLTGLEEPVLFYGNTSQAGALYHDDTLRLKVSDIKTYNWMLENAHVTLKELNDDPNFIQAWALRSCMQHYKNTSSFGESTTISVDPIEGIRKELGFERQQAVSTETKREMGIELDLARRVAEAADAILQRAKAMPERDYHKAIETLADSQRRNEKLITVLQNI